MIEHGGSIDLSTIRPFSSAGFAGTLRSTLVLRLGRARRPHFSDEPPDFGKPHRVRDTEVSVLRTRCGGPMQTDVASVRSFASGSVPTAALRHRQVTIHLTRNRAIVPTAAWQGSLKSDLTVTLVRTRVREQVFTERY